MAAEFFDIVRNARSHKLGPFSPIFNIQTVLMDKVKRYVPADAHLKVNGRLHLSLTRIYDGKNIIVSQFNSREDLIEALACSFFIPGALNSPCLCFEVKFGLFRLLWVGSTEIPQRSIHGRSLF